MGWSCGSTFNLYNDRWPIYTVAAHRRQVRVQRRGQQASHAPPTAWCDGCIISGGHVHGASEPQGSHQLSRWARTSSSNVSIGRRCRSPTIVTSVESRAPPSALAGRIMALPSPQGVVFPQGHEGTSASAGCREHEMAEPADGARNRRRRAVGVEQPGPVSARRSEDRHRGVRTSRGTRRSAKPPQYRGTAEAPGGCHVGDDENPAPCPSIGCRRSRPNRRRRTQHAGPRDRQRAHDERRPRNRVFIRRGVADRSAARPCGSSPAVCCRSPRWVALPPANHLHRLRGRRKPGPGWPPWVTVRCSETTPAAYCDSTAAGASCGWRRPGRNRLPLAVAPTAWWRRWWAETCSSPSMGAGRELGGPPASSGGGGGPRQRILLLDGEGGCGRSPDRGPGRRRVERLARRATRAQARTLVASDADLMRWGPQPSAPLRQRRGVTLEGRPGLRWAWPWMARGLGRRAGGRLVLTGGQGGRARCPHRPSVAPALSGARPGMVGLDDRAGGSRRAGGSSLPRHCWTDGGRCRRVAGPAAGAHQRERQPAGDRLVRPGSPATARWTARSNRPPGPVAWQLAAGARADSAPLNGEPSWTLPPRDVLRDIFGPVMDRRPAWR